MHRTLISSSMPTFLEKLRRSIRRSETCNRLLRHVRPTYRQFAVAADTQFVMESYPRCANTFAALAFMRSQPRPVKVAHHLHSVAQLRRGVRRGLPTLAIIRSPKEAILSVTIRKGFHDIRWGLDEYIDFHEGVAELGDAVLIADFQEVIADFGSVIRRVNQRWGTDFGVFEHTEDNVAACYREIDEIEQERAGGSEVRATHVARPSERRQEQKRLLAQQWEDPTFRPRVNEAERLYALLSERHASELAPAPSTHG
jgi:hypothetical protein